MYYKINHIIKERKKVLLNSKRTKFCAAVISNNFSSNNFRLRFINQLNKYKKIDMGGRVFNNIGGPIENKIKFLSSYKFSICMENSEGDGYVSEKIIDSFLAGTIPIYYGDYMVDEYINPKSFILINGEKDIFDKIEYIKKIDNDYELYKKMLKQKVFLNKHFIKKIEKEKKNFFLNIFKQDIKKAKRIDNI